MPNRIFLKPVAPYNANHSRYDWSLYDTKGLKVAGGDSAPMDDVLQILMQNGAENVRAVLVWPGNLCFTTQIEIPGKGNRYLQQALAFAVEEKVASDIELLHFAVGTGPSKNTHIVHCIEKSLVLGFYDDILEAQPELQLVSAHVDADVLPLEEFDIVVSIEGEWALVKQVDQTVSVLKHNLTAYLDSVFLAPDDETEQTARIKVYLHQETDADHKILLAELAQYPGASVETETLSIRSLDLLAESYVHNGAPSIDLCQGDLKIQNESSGQYKQWAWVAGVAALAFILQVGVFLGKGFYYQNQADDIGQQALTAYKQVVPASRNVSLGRLARIIKGKLRSASNEVSDAGFLTLLGEAGYQFKQQSAQALRFTSVTYSSQRGELIIELRAESFEQMDQLKNAIVASGMSAKISSAVQEESYYRGRLSVSQG